MNKYFEFKKGREIEWLELNLLRTAEPISKSLIIGLAEGYFEEEEIEKVVDGWIRELVFRNSLYSNSFYQINQNRIIPLKSWDEIPEYYLCVYYSYFGAKDATIGTKLFEKISALSLKNFIGGETYSLGFPEGKALNDYLDDFTIICHEKRGLKAHADYKDDGVDVIGFKLFDDKRSSNLYVLQQCAAGNNWRTKNKIEINRWSHYILWYPECIIFSIATVDFVSQREWEKRSSTYGMLIDRIRIYNTLYQNDMLESLRNEVLEWAQHTLN